MKCIIIVLSFLLSASIASANPNVNSVQASPPPPPKAEVAKKKSSAQRVFFRNLKNGAKVKSPLKIRMGVVGMKVCLANEPTTDKKCGHHHLIVDQSFIPEGQPVPVSETHMHFGKKQTETEIKFTPGEHTLTLQFADFAHISYGEAMSQTIKVTVE